jgi:peptidoglycan-associated lipoprotein
MKRFQPTLNGVAGILIVAALAACSSTGGKEQSGAAVEDRNKPGPPTIDVDRKPIVPAEPTARPYQSDDPSRAALRDPNNILSKRSVFFDYDSNLVKDEYKPLVAAHARYLQQNGTTKMSIQGNADDRGSREYNLALGQRRADAVKQMMQILGAKADQIETVSFGEEKPRCNEAAESCWAQNRRGDIVYQGE